MQQAEVETHLLDYESEMLLLDIGLDFGVRCLVLMPRKTVDGRCTLVWVQSLLTGAE